jgi:hypothetical protein
MPRPWLGVLVLLVALTPLGAARLPGSARTPRLAVPARPPDGLTGSEFLKQTNGLAEVDRQRAAVGELERGNMPHSMRELRPVTIRFDPPGGRSVVATIWVTPDYLAIGPDGDSLYIPLTLPAAIDVARRFECVLPTPKMVDAIYRQAGVRLTPQPLPPGPQMRSNAYYARHQKLIAAQRAGTSLDALVSGHKKDLVLTNRLFDRPDRVAIYGWHQSDGHPIQPLSTVHGVRYADYSHAVRLVWHDVAIDGTRRSIYDVLADPDLAPALSDEGALRDPRALMNSRAR